MNFNRPNADDFSLVERAIIDAFCRSRRQAFASALQDNSFGIELGGIHPELAGTQLPPM